MLTFDQKAQARKVMPLVGPLLDAWETAPNDVKSDIREFATALAAHLDAINTAMEAEQDE